MDPNERRRGGVIQRIYSGEMVVWQKGKKVAFRVALVALLARLGAGMTALLASLLRLLALTGWHPITLFHELTRARGSMAL